MKDPLDPCALVLLGIEEISRIASTARMFLALTERDHFEFSLLSGFP